MLASNIHSSYMLRFSITTSAYIILYALKGIDIIQMKKRKRVCYKEMMWYYYYKVGVEPYPI